MKKLFSFRSSASGSANSVGDSPSSTDKTCYPLFDNRSTDKVGEKYSNNLRSPRGLVTKSRNQASDSQSSSTFSGSGLRKSRSLSSANFLAEALEQKNSSSSLSDQSRSPARHQHSEYSPCRQTISPEKRSKLKEFDGTAYRNGHGFKKPGYIVTYDDASLSSNCSSRVSNKVVDRYIDGEQHQERSRPKKTFQKIHTGKDGGNRPPRVQYTAPTSPTDSVKCKPRAQSFREAESACPHYFSGDWVESGFGHESPRRLAKNVIERLSQTTVFPKISSKEFDQDIPITIEDIYGESLNKCSHGEVVIHDDIPSYETDETTKRCHRENSSGLHMPLVFHMEKCEPLCEDVIGEDVDFELQRRLEGAQQRVAFLSQEVEQDHFLIGISFDVPTLIQTVRNLSEDRMSLAVEVSELLQSRMSDRASLKEELRLAKMELESKTRRLEKEKKELQSGLEKELDRRSSDWSSKLEKFQIEEQRLRERVRELAEQNVSLQREVCLVSEKETECRSSMTYSEQKVKELMEKLEELSMNNHEFEQTISELQEKYVATKENGELLKRSFHEKEKECKELHKSIARLMRTCSDQEKTIEGLREGFSEEFGKPRSPEMTDKHLAKLRMEQIRLTGIELALRRELESTRREKDSLRRENISLLSRLNCNGKDSGDLMFQLDQEISTRLCCLQNEALSTVNDSSHLCSKLLDFIKLEFSHIKVTKQGTEAIKNSLDEQFIVESDMKVHGIKRRTESLMRSLQTISGLLREKSKPFSKDTQGADASGSMQLNDQTCEDTLISELKAESLMTSLLREKLYCKELEVEQLQAELATAVRSADIVKYEVQNALDNLSCVTHKFKDLELQMLKKDERISELENDLQDARKEMGVLRGILPKVSQERDLMWDEVKQYSEKNMLLNSEISMLKKKIDVLDEDILVKEGQITILKDSLGNKPFDLLASPDFAREFLLE
ncbi:COP1-interactive protein 1 isoform X1 [Rhodamnia argentea]|uniref:COP1-interactive protein 1 isoform X1 n=1 Tax=Rhodamnia argentea TaxID=178133 RepID=A0A8B8QH79_9MYRT|nr:COP1-interactive protein 1 isoform X1 [Rhodamnia argentea]